MWRFLFNHKSPKIFSDNKLSENLSPFTKGDDVRAWAMPLLLKRGIFVGDLSPYKNGEIIVIISL